MANAYAEEEQFHMRQYGGKLYPDMKDELHALVKKYRFIYCEQLPGGIY